MKLLIIEPWFGSFGHPAQSLFNTASAIGRDDRVDYLVSFDRRSVLCKDWVNRLTGWGNVFCFDVNTQTGKSNTVRALLALVRLRLTGRSYRRIFFFDGSLLVLALLWPIFSLVLSVKRISVLNIQGPEVIGGGRVGRFIVKLFLMRSDVQLYLRTEELAQAWRVSFAGKIRHLPSMEIPDTGDDSTGSDAQRVAVIKPSSKVKFGIIGQVRPGKGIDWLVPLFKNDPAIGDLMVAGSFYDQKCSYELSVLEDFEGFKNKFLTENEMLNLAAAQDYLLMLYDQYWDPRLESAILYLAARVNRPVVVYGGSWSGRMVKEYGCGLLADHDHEIAAKMLKHIPHPGSVEYTELLNGMNDFRAAHSTGALRSLVVGELLG